MFNLYPILRSFVRCIHDSGVLRMLDLYESVFFDLFCWIFIYDWNENINTESINSSVSMRFCFFVRLLLVCLWSAKIGTFDTHTLWHCMCTTIQTREKIAIKYFLPANPIRFYSKQSNVQEFFFAQHKAEKSDFENEKNHFRWIVHSCAKSSFENWNQHFVLVLLRCRRKKNSQSIFLFDFRNTSHSMVDSFICNLFYNSVNRVTHSSWLRQNDNMIFDVLTFSKSCSFIVTEFHNENVECIDLCSNQNHQVISFSLHLPGILYSHRDKLLIPPEYFSQARNFQLK